MHIARITQIGRRRESEATAHPRVWVGVLGEQYPHDLLGVDRAGCAHRVDERDVGPPPPRVMLRPGISAYETHGRGKLGHARGVVHALGAAVRAFDAIWAEFRRVESPPTVSLTHPRTWSPPLTSAPSLSAFLTFSTSPRFAATRSWVCSTLGALPHTSVLVFAVERHVFFLFLPFLLCQLGLRQGWSWRFLPARHTHQLGWRRGCALHRGRPRALFQ